MVAHLLRNDLSYCDRKMNSETTAKDVWILDKRLEAEAKSRAELPLCELMPRGENRFPWVVLIPRRAGIAESFDLAPEDRAILWEEVDRVAAALKELTGAAKINIAAYRLPFNDVVIDMGKFDRLIWQTKTKLRPNKLIQHSDVVIHVVTQDGTVPDKLQYLLQCILDINPSGKITFTDFVNLNRITR